MERRTKTLMAIAVLAIFFALPVIGIVEGSGGGLVVPNIPPTFKEVDIDLQNNEHTLSIEVFDTNGAWGSLGDVHRVTVRIYDINENVIAAYRFQQYDAINSTLTINEFSEVEGTSDILKIADCKVEHPSITGVISTGEQQLAGSQLNLTFVSKAIDGFRVRITVEDREGESSTIDNPYFKSAPTFSRGNAMAAGLVSLAISSVVSTAVMAGSRGG